MKKGIVLFMVLGISLIVSVIYFTELSGRAKEGNNTLGSSQEEDVSPQVTIKKIEESEILSKNEIDKTEEILLLMNEYNSAQNREADEILVYEEKKLSDKNL